MTGAMVAHTEHGGHLLEALAEWHRLSGIEADPVTATVLKDSTASHVYRLPGAGPGGKSIIAKQRRTSAVAVERSVYADVRPLMPVSVAEHYGAVVKGEFTWLFLEDVGVTRFDPDVPSHVRAMARWLATVHRAFGDGRPPSLPDHGPPRYATHLASARERIRRASENPAVDVDARSTLSRVDDLLHGVSLRWTSLEQCGHILPATLVHGDLQPKNILIRAADPDVAVVPIDWETSGWGPPAPDLASLAHEARSVPDCLQVYRRALERPGLAQVDVETSVHVGQAFNLLAAMDWVSHRLDTAWIAKPLRDLPVFAARLRHQMQLLGLEV